MASMIHALWADRGGVHSPVIRPADPGEVEHLAGGCPIPRFALPDHGLGSDAAFGHKLLHRCKRIRPVLLTAGQHIPGFIGKVGLPGMDECPKQILRNLFYSLPDRRSWRRRAKAGSLTVAS